MTDFTLKSLDLSGLEEKFSGAALRAKQAAFAKRVAFDDRRHVPLDEGQLRDSEPLSSDYENGRIVWNTPYAKRVYNLDSVNTGKNPEATPHWHETTKQEKLQDWRQFAAGLLCDGKGGTP